ncbi:IscS subfamily cysteine desulfurase [Pullulanibacillus pueri]|nr:IscS subfamily cysteine desulfurase [Pullulanibacillus pueri]
MMYLDYAATTPMSEQALEAYIKASRNFYGNTMSPHDFGTEAHQLLEATRLELARCLNAHSSGIYFTSGGSESSLLAITSLARAHHYKGKHLITTKIEHPSIDSAIQLLESEGFTCTYLPVNKDGRIDLGDLQNAIREDTILVSIGHVNNEIGVIQPIEEIGQLLAEHHILFHTDAVQSFGKRPIDVKKAKITSLSISSHKIYGPKGVGACYIDPSIHWQPFLSHVSHEHGFRQGTINTPGIAAFITAAMDIVKYMDIEYKRMEELKHSFVREVRRRALPVVIEGCDTGESPHHLPSILPLRVLGLEGQLVMLECNRRGLALSTGAACKAGQSLPSKTMRALGRSENEALEFIRISLGVKTTSSEVFKAVDILESIILAHSH